MVRAALLHDIGKRHARLGTAGRSWAVVRSAMGRRPSTRAATYLNHGTLGSDELAAGGAEPLAVAYALHHHGNRPDGIPPEDWAVLDAADRASFPAMLPVIRPRQRPRPARSATYDGISPAVGASSHDL